MSHFQPIHIGDSGWRAIYTAGFTVDRLSAIASALTRLYSFQKILIGFDNRFLSKEFAHHLAIFLQSKKWKVTLISDSFPTPGVAKEVREKNFDWGFVITASHNPYYYSGIKIFNSEGILIGRDLVQKIQDQANTLLQREKMPSFDPQKKFFPESDLKSFEQFYLESVFKWIDVKAIRKANLSVVWDGFGGTTSFLFPKFLQFLKVRNDPVPFFPEPTYQKRKLEPDATSLVELGKKVGKKKADLGLATDVDGDRFAIIDEKGNYLLNNLLGSLILRYLLEVRKERGVVYQTVSSSALNEKICDKNKTVLRIMPVGFQVMGHEMSENRSSLIGLEETGGFAYAPHLCFKDGLIAHAFFLEMLATQKKSIGQLIQDLYKKHGRFFYERIDLKLESEKELEKYQTVSFWEKKLKRKIVSTDRLDGIKFRFEGESWLLIRSSKTEPLLRIYFESGEKNFLKEVKFLIHKSLSSRRPTQNIL